QHRLSPHVRRKRPTLHRDIPSFSSHRRDTATHSDRVPLACPRGAQIRFTRGVEGANSEGCRRGAALLPACEDLLGPRSMRLVLSGLSVVLIDLLLAGDNALVIAMAVRTLPVRERLLGTAGGAGAAVILRVALTFLAAQLLGLPYLQLAGGLL